MIRLLSGDCRDVLPTLPAESVQCVVTSPPYLGLRDYGTALWDGGDAVCDHAAKQPKRGNPTYTNGQTTKGYESTLQAWGDRDVSTVYRDTCGKCGAVRVDRQIGLEATPEAYLATMVGVFRQIRRVMRSDAVAFINMGDAYRDKQLLLMPARLALALQADGWWVRSDIIIAKKNPMPESCRDRPTSAHEHVFLLTKAARYYFDPDAVRETSITNDLRRPYGSQGAWELDGRPAEQRHGGELRNIKVPGGWDRGDGAHGTIHRGGRTSAEYQDAAAKTGRNIRNVWDISAEAFSGAHFATMPTSVVERCIKAGTSERGCCSQCGKPWVRVTEDTEDYRAFKDAERERKGTGMRSNDMETFGLSRGTSNASVSRQTTTTGWSRGCQCDAATVPCTVLDPFAGAGTTLLVADRLQRDAIGIELNVDYTRMAMDRCRADAPLFTAFPPAEDPEDERMGDLFTDMAAD